VFDIEAVRGNDSNTLEAWAWRMESIEAIEDVEANGISNGLFHNELIGKPIQLLPPVAANGAVAGFQYTWRSSTVESIDRSTTVGLEDGSVRASNGGRPNRLEVVSFTFKGLLLMESRPLP